MSNDQQKPEENKEVTKLDQINQDLEGNTLKENEQGQIEGGFAAGQVKVAPVEGNNIWCNEHC
jgi:hypothetical protein